MWPDYNESSCRDNHSYFDSADYLRNAYHCTAILTIPLSLFTFYTIIKVTPKRMKSMRPVLLISHVCSTNLDLMFTVYSAPYIFFPSASGVPLGILGAVGIGVKWQSYWGQVSAMMMGVSFIMLYENRQSQITTIKFKIPSKNARLIYYGANYIFAFTVMLPFYLDDSDQVEMRKVVLERIPCPTIEFFDPKTYVLLKGGEIIPFWSITIGVGSMIGQAMFFALHTTWHLTVVANNKTSSATRRLQQRFLGYVSIQIAIPLIALACPVTYSMYADKYNYYNQAYNNNAMLVMANHGLLCTLSTLFIYKPYRDFVKNVLSGNVEERRVSTTVEHIASRMDSISH